MASIKAAFFKVPLNAEGKKMIKNALDVIRFTIRSAADKMEAPVDVLTMVISAELTQDILPTTKSDKKGGE